MILLNDRQYKANLHCHSTLSDGRLTPEELKEAYKKHGYSVLAITDHERPHDHSGLNEDGFLLLTGYEAYIRPDPAGRYNRWANEVHLNLFATRPDNTDLICAQREYMKYMPEEEYVRASKVGPVSQREFSPEYVNFFIRTAKEDGYLVSYNHPGWSLETIDEVRKYEGCFSMEVFTYNSWTEGIEEYSGGMYDALLREGKRIFVHATDDNHNAVPFGRPGSDSFGGFTMICAEDLSYGSVIEAMKNGSFYASSGPLIKSLETDGQTVRVTTTPASEIIMRYGSKTPGVARPEETGLTVNHAEFKLPPEAKYFRIHVRGTDGTLADSRGYFRDEWESAE